MGMLDELNDIGKARANNKSDFIRDGKGVLLLEECIYDKMNDGRTWVSRFEVVEAVSKGDLDKDGKPVVPNAVGSHVGWVQQPEKFKSAAGNIKSFVLALLGYSEAEVDANPGSFGQAADQLRGPTQPGRGMLIGFETYRQATRSGARPGQVNTYVRFFHIGPEAGNSKEKIAERRAVLDAKTPLKK